MSGLDLSSIDGIKEYIASHVPPELVWVHNQSSSTRDTSERTKQFLRDTQGISLIFDGPLLDDLASDLASAFLPRPQEPSSLGLSIDLESTDRFLAQSAKINSIKTEVRDMYPFFSHGLFVIWSALLDLVGLSAETTAWTSTSALPHSSDFCLRVNQYPLALMELKRPIVIDGYATYDLIQNLIDNGPATIAFDPSSGNFWYPEYLSENLFKAIMQLVEDMDGQRIAYGVLTSYEDYLVICRRSAKNFHVSQIIRRRLPPSIAIPSSAVIPAAQSTEPSMNTSTAVHSYSPIHHMRPLQLLLALAVLGNSQKRDLSIYKRRAERAVQHTPSKRRRGNSSGLWSRAGPSSERTSDAGDGSAPEQGKDGGEDEDVCPLTAEELGASDIWPSLSTAAYRPEAPFSSPKSEKVTTPKFPSFFANAQELLDRKHQDHPRVQPNMIVVVPASGHRLPSSHSASLADFLRLHILRQLSSSPRAAVFLAQTMTNDEDNNRLVVVKASLLHDLDREHAVLLALRSLWGGMVPQMIGYFSWDGISLLVTEYIGDKIPAVHWGLLNENDKENIRNLYAAIHSCGVVHGDIQPRHVIRRSALDASFSTDLALIDFGNAYITSNPADFERERRGVEYRFNSTLPEYII